MRLVPNNPAVWVGVVAFAAFLIVAWFIPSDPFNYLLRIALITTAVLTLLRWGKTGWRVFWEGARDPEDAAILSQNLIAIAFIEYGLFTIYARYLGTPDWLTNSVLPALFPFLVILGFGLAVFSTRLKGEKPSPAISIVLAIATATAMAAIGALGKIAALIAIVGKTIMR